jgi:predicted RNA-binding protein
MAQYWIFVSLPFSDFNRGDINVTMRKVQATGKWPIGKNTVNRKQLSKGDMILFYLAGEEGKKFIGSGELLSDLTVNEKNFDSFVTLGNMKLWKNQIAITDVLNELSFIKNKKHWGLHFQGGIVRIPEKDFRLILRKVHG